ncbi:XkdX family protein [Anaerotignum propionicum]|nr:XkdX family protein [Anaerotignum propionicum]MCQ4936775.1 XkdX family protein [Anaerotignum propionicum]
MIYKIVKRYFDSKIYSAANVGMFVQSGKISAEQYVEITGQEYEVV